MESVKIRRSALAGTWYPENPAELRRSVEGYIALGDLKLSKSSAAPRSGRICGLILPHAGHKYSGRTCGVGIAAIRGRSFSRIVLLGPSHRTYVRGAVVSGATHFDTPLGAVPVDLEAVQKLSRQGLPSSDDPHRNEHCLEILLPFFQIALDQFRIVPILLGPLADSECVELAATLRSVVDDQTLVVASSDFVHYGEDFDYTPDVGPDVRAGVRKLDEDAIDYIESMDAPGLLEYRRLSGATICGILPIAVLLDVLPKNCRIDRLDYSQSADVTNETDNLVSYAAISFSAP